MQRYGTVLVSYPETIRPPGWQLNSELVGYSPVCGCSSIKLLQMLRAAIV